MKKWSLLALLTATLVAGVAVASWAAPMTFDLIGFNDPNLEANVVFSYTPGTGTINIDVTNTSLLAAGPDPRLTAFAFNVPSGVTGFSNFTGPSGWSGFFDSNNINTPDQFGQFDIAGITGPNFNGGSPNDGIPRSSTFGFQFILTGSGLSGLDENSFLSELSFDPAENPDEDEQFFIGRFQRTGADGEGSDVAIPDRHPTEVPEPSTMLLLGSGLMVLCAVARRGFVNK